MGEQLRTLTDEEATLVSVTSKDTASIKMCEIAPSNLKETKFKITCSSVINLIQKRCL